MKKFISTVKEYISKYLIGFRSKDKNKMMLAGAYYAFSLLMAISSGRNFLFSLAFLVCIPFVVFSIKEANDTKKYEKLVVIPICFVILIAMNMLSGAIGSAIDTISNIFNQPQEIYLTDKEIIFEEINETKPVEFTVQPEDADVSKVEIVSENPDIVKVEGLFINSVSPGETKIYATVQDGEVKSTKITVKVEDKEAKLLEEAKVIIEQIEKIGEVTLESDEAIQSAKKAYDSASPEVQEKVENHSTLSEADTKYQQLKKEEEERIQKEKEEAERIQKEKEEQEKKAQEQQEAQAASKSSSYQEAESSGGGTVYIGKTGTKYHKSSCRTLKGNGRAISLSEAQSQGRTACKVCGG